MDKKEKVKILRLKEVMQELRWSRERLAEEAEVSVTTISNINSELHLPSIETLVRIAEVMDVDVRDLFRPTKPSSVSQKDLQTAIEHFKSGLRVLEGNAPASENNGS
jgi:DNA-binding XRE family transcriptional regulator